LGSPAPPRRGGLGLAREPALTAIAELVRIVLEIALSGDE
jgi:hypothetical protein